VPYHPGWAVAFEEERVRLEAVLGTLALGIEHYGSTAVPGLAAKPILDIIVGVAHLDDWQRCHDPLIGLGYDYAASAGVAGHYIFGRGRDLTERTHLVHVVLFGSESWLGNLAFRDALRRDPHLCERYLEIKKRAVQAAPDSRARYNELK
jgi:GrpB-like predicted nucleotidyltransferase (UPF0157 family)